MSLKKYTVESFFKIGKFSFLILSFVKDCINRRTTLGKFNKYSSENVVVLMRQAKALENTKVVKKLRTFSPLSVRVC